MKLLIQCILTFYMRECTIPDHFVRILTKGLDEVLCRHSGYNIWIKHVFPFINIRWVPREVFKTEGSARGFQHRTRIPANVNARENMFDRYYCIKVSNKSILERYFDVLFWHYFVLIFLHRRTKIISICILVPGPSVNNCSIMTENWQEFTTWWQSLQNVVVVCHLF